ncbi:hypothetical protein CBS101457_003657 [Exobasidium rhododendri]|nr:hypothetical protein CBS101457_003657 [Exobasidium rhododendri]
MSSQQASTSRGTRSQPKKTIPAKAALLGNSSQAAETSSAASASAPLPRRAPFGQEEEDNEEENGLELDVQMQGDGDDDELMIGDGVALESNKDSTSNAKNQKSTASDSNLMSIDPTLKPTFKPLSKGATQSAQDALDVTRGQLRKVPIPPHRMTPLKNEWPKIYTPLVEMAGLQVRMNVKRKTVEIKSSKHTSDVGILQKGADFVKAFALGFEADDAIALLRIDDLFVDSFEIKDVKTLHGDHLSRAIGRIAGKDGRTRFAIENASRTRVVVADTKIHIMGSFTNIKIARDAIVALIMGSPPGKVYANLKTVGARQRQRG